MPPTVHAAAGTARAGLLALVLAVTGAGPGPAVAGAQEVPRAGFWLLEPVIEASRQVEETAASEVEGSGERGAGARGESSARVPSNERRLLRELRAVMRAAGPASGAWVRDATGDRLLFGRRSTRTLRLGSNAKLFTVAAALVRHGPDARIATTVVGDGRLRENGDWSGDLYLVGGGDPTLDDGAIDRLARELEAAGVQRVTGRVLGDESAFDAVRGTAYTGRRRSAAIGGSLSALGVDDLVVRDPARWAAGRLDEALEGRGVDVRARPRVGEAPAGAEPLASVESPELARIARTTLTYSSNFYAEMLAKLVGSDHGRRTGTTDRGTAAVTRFARRFGAEVQLADGAGLAAGSRGSPRSVGRLLEGMLERPEGEAFADAFAVAGRRGTLRDRLRGTDAAGSCRAKSGTRPRVSALSGYCRGAGGDTIVFSLVLNGVDVARGKRLEDRAVEAIARYG